MKHLDWKRVGGTVKYTMLVLLTIVIFSLPVLIFTLGAYFIGDWIIINLFRIDLAWLIDWFAGCLFLLLLYVTWYIGKFLYWIGKGIVKCLPDAINFYYHNGEEEK